MNGNKIMHMVWFSTLSQEKKKKNNGGIHGWQEIYLEVEVAYTNAEAYAVLATTVTGTGGSVGDTWMLTVFVCFATPITTAATSVVARAIKRRTMSYTLTDLGGLPPKSSFPWFIIPLELCFALDSIVCVWASEREREIRELSYSEGIACIYIYR